MRRFLTLSEAESALNRGKQIEQFLGGYLAYGDPAIRYAVIRIDKDKFTATVYERFEPSQAGFYDVGEFASVLPDDDPEDHVFDSLDQAISFLMSEYGASQEKFLNQGVVDAEYRDYREGREKS